MLFTRLGFIATAVLSILQPVFSGGTETTPSTTSSIPVTTVHVASIRPDVLELQNQMSVKGTMPPAYWHDVAICETSTAKTRENGTGNWQDRGSFSGGLGIYVGTWRAYGGREFAPKPAQATIEQQMIVANRIAVLGFQTKHEYRTLEDKLNNKPFFRPAVGFNGWGCIRNNQYLRPQNWRNAHRTEWRRQKKNVQYTP
jgi:hypothetical protein